MRCNRCRQDNPSHAKFCLECGTPIPGAVPDAGSHADLNDQIDNLRHSLSEALEQQTAASEVLQIISRSTFDLQPVLDTLVENAARLCDASTGLIWRFDGEVFRLTAHHGLSPEARDFWMRNPHRPGRGSVTGRAALERRPIHIPDVLADPEYGATEGQRVGGYRALLGVPMLREDVLIGCFSLERSEPRPFACAQIELITTFADQAVIAIENVRLFTELQERNRELTEALDRQTATAEILRVIGTSPTDTQPVFEAIARSGVRVCGGLGCAVFVIDGDLVRLAATHGIRPERIERFRSQFPAPLMERPDLVRVLRDHQIVHLPDIEGNPQSSPEHVEEARLGGYRTRLMVPMVRGRTGVGMIAVTREAPTPFSDRQVELLKTFADQAVIAIENVRLFKELEARTGELTRSVKELKALGEVGQAVSSSLDLETVLTTIVSRAVQLSGLDGGTVFEYNEASEEFVQRATTGIARVVAGRAVVRKGEGVVGRTAVTLEPVEVSDILVGGAYESRLREALVEAGVRAIIAVPIIREGRLLGGFAVNRNAPGEFPPETVELLRTFATQSALAIQNARLYHEIEDKSRQLEAASQHKSEFLANMSHELRTPLNAIIGFSEVLSDRMFGELNDKQTEYLQDIHASGEHLLSLINDILDLSKIEAGRMELELSDFHLPTAIDNALTLVRERAARRGITLHATIDSRLGDVEADERKFKQIVLNLLSNAIKFTPEGGRIVVSATRTERAVEVTVSDTGIGIAPEHHEAIFEEFRQVGMVEKKIEGTGLGLSLSKRFVELHGGRIWVTSQTGQGSTFTFTLPVSRPEGSRLDM